VRAQGRTRRRFRSFVGRWGKQRKREERREVGEEVLTSGARGQREKGKEGRPSARLGPGKKEMGLLGPRGREGKEPEEEREREVESWAGPKEWAALFYSLSFPFSLL
jgi:hypothetical protein